MGTGVKQPASSPLSDVDVRMYGTLPPFERYEWGDNVLLNVHLFYWSGKTLYHCENLSLIVLKMRQKPGI